MFLKKFPDSWNFLQIVNSKKVKNICFTIVITRSKTRIPGKDCWSPEGCTYAGTWLLQPVLLSLGRESPGLMKSKWCICPHSPPLSTYSEETRMPDYTHMCPLLPSLWLCRLQILSWGYLRKVYYTHSHAGASAAVCGDVFFIYFVFLFPPHVPLFSAST